MSASKPKNIIYKLICSQLLIQRNFLSSYRNRSTSGTVNESEFPEHGLVRDGTPCGENLVCVNQTCVSIFPYIDTSKCPVNHNNQECSGNGVSCDFVGVVHQLRNEMKRV